VRIGSCEMVCIILRLSLSKLIYLRYDLSLEEAGRLLANLVCCGLERLPYERCWKVCRAWATRAGGTSKRSISFGSRRMLV
jgi:hypothetical protein